MRTSIFVMFLLLQIDMPQLCNLSFGCITQTIGTVDIFLVIGYCYFLWRYPRRWLEKVRTIFTIRSTCYREYS